MQVEAVYNHGTLQFVHPLKLKHDHLRLVVVVPDDEIELEPGTPCSTMGERVNNLLAPYQHLLGQGARPAPTDHKALWHDHLEEKYLRQHEKSDI